jgi:hypothetical protein
MVNGDYWWSTLRGYKCKRFIGSVCEVVHTEIQSTVRTQLLSLLRIAVAEAWEQYRNPKEE